MGAHLSPGPGETGDERGGGEASVGEGGVEGNVERVERVGRDVREREGMYTYRLIDPLGAGQLLVRLIMLRYPSPGLTTLIEYGEDRTV